MKTLKLLPFFLFILFIVGCNNPKKKKNAAIQVRNFYSAVQSGDEEKMVKLYPGLAFLDSYYKSDTSVIRNVSVLENNTIIVKTTSQYTTGLGVKNKQNIDFYLMPDSLDKFSYRIVDSKGLTSYEENPIFKFGTKTGCISSSDTTDMQIALKLIRAELFMDLKILEVKLELMQSVTIVDWNWESGYAGSASGNGIVKNNSDFNLPKLKFTINYKDRNGNVITSDDGYVTYDTFYSGQSKSFTFYTSYVGDASKASLLLQFDDELIKNYLVDDEYSGNECDEFYPTSEKMDD